MPPTRAIAPRTGAAVTVLKIGGSLTASDAALRLMRGLAERRPPGLLIVPGGGAFADRVRATQAQHGLGEQAAHHMALLAMHMVAVLLADLAPGFALAEGPGQFQSAWTQGLTPIWLPAPMVMSAADIPASWDVTSDSLAAWIAERTGATRLVLVKSCTVPAQRDDARALAAAGVVDACFPRFVERRRFSWEVISGWEPALSLVSAGERV